MQQQAAQHQMRLVSQPIQHSQTHQLNSAAAVVAASTASISVSGLTAPVSGSAASISVSGLTAPISVSGLTAPISVSGSAASIVPAVQPQEVIQATTSHLSNEFYQHYAANIATFNHMYKQS